MQQNESPLIRALTEYYDGQKILSTNFNCVHLAKCQGCLLPTPASATAWEDVVDKFTQAKSSCVGDLYGTMNPRLVFVTLDSGSVLKKRDPKYSFVSPESRTPQGVWSELARIMKLIASGEDKAQRPTLKGQNELAEAILQGFPGALTGVHVMRQYANVNAAKCTTNKEGRQQAAGRLFRNCSAYIPNEIAALAPHVIVSLGKEAGRSLTRILKGEKAARNFGHAPGDEIISLNKRDIFWIHAPHPTARDGSFRQFLQTEVTQAIERLRDFISNRDSRFPSPAF